MVVEGESQHVEISEAATVTLFCPTPSKASLN